MRGGTTSSPTMTPTENQLFRTYQSTIQDVASKLRSRYVHTYKQPHGYYEDFQQELLLSAPNIILINNLTSVTDVHKYLMTHYGYKLKDYCRKLRIHLKKQSVPRNENDDNIPENIEDSVNRDKTDKKESVDELQAPLNIILKAAPKEIRQLCQIYLKSGAWSAATPALGWSKGKVYRLQKEVIRFFSDKKSFFWGI